MAEHISIGLMGLGVVGTGVATAVRERAYALSQRIGAPVRIDHVLVRETGSVRPMIPGELSLTADPNDIIKNPNISLVIEVMGGVFPAHDLISAAIAAGKHVITANKEVMAKYGPDLLRAAADKGVMLRFEASVGGGIPIIGPLLDDLAANDISAVNAIINGTTNYMLTKMATDGLDYHMVLQEAQALGYAESDPAADIDGVDAAFKLAILASLAFRTVVRDTDVFREGISHLTPSDFRYAKELGYVIKLLAIARRTKGRVLARVHPAFLPTGHPLAKVDGVYNAVELEGDLVDWAMFQGPGAGARPTASAILADVVAIGRAIVGGARVAPSPLLDKALTIETLEDLETKYYIRLRASDRPGVMAQVTRVLGDLNVGLASVIQEPVGETGKTAEIVVTTHLAREGAVQQALHQLSALDSVDEVGSLIRIEERIE
jgi:homoserine dehydrogenase